MNIQIIPSKIFANIFWVLCQKKIWQNHAFAQFLFICCTDKRNYIKKLEMCTIREKYIKIIIIHHKMKRKFYESLQAQVNIEENTILHFFSQEFSSFSYNLISFLSQLDWKILWKFINDGNIAHLGDIRNE